MHLLPSTARIRSRTGRSKSNPLSGFRRIRTVVVSTTVVGAFGMLAGVPASAGGLSAAVPSKPSLPGQMVSGMMPAGAPDAATSNPAGTSAKMQAAAATSYLLGTDVSSYQHPGGQLINWAAVATSGESFTVVKATESTNYTNPYMATDVTGARGAGLVVGVYHFAHPEISATAQADYFAQQVNGIAGTMLPPVLDLEQTGGLSSTALITWTSSFLTRLRQDTGRIPMIYSGPYFWSTAMAGSTAFTQYPLWEAHYTTAAQPQFIPGWPTYSVWQYSNGSFGKPTPVPGVPALVDRDRFGGTKAQLAALASSSRPGIQAPFSGSANASQFPDSTFIQVAGDHHVYELAGLAPLWVTSWSHLRGPGPVRTVSLAAFYTLRSSPVDGTLLNDLGGGHIYRVVGGAPVIMTSWAPVGGHQPSVQVDGWDIANAGVCGGYCHLSQSPRDGTIVRAVETGEVYVIAGGAPIYVSSWSSFGGAQPYVNISQAAVQNAGTGIVYDHLTFTPADATVISDGNTGQLYVVTAGHPQLAPPGSVGATGFTLVDHAAIANAGGAGVWAHLL